MTGRARQEISVCCWFLFGQWTPNQLPRHSSLQARSDQQRRTVCAALCLSGGGDGELVGQVPILAHRRERAKAWSLSLLDGVGGLRGEISREQAPSSQCLGGWVAPQRAPIWSLHISLLLNKHCALVRRRGVEKGGDGEVDVGQRKRMDSALKTPYLSTTACLPCLAGSSFFLLSLRARTHGRAHRF